MQNRHKAALAALFLAAGIQSATAEEITLKVSHFLPGVATAQAKVLQPWCDAIQQQSSGRLKCQLYPAMLLGGTPPQLVDQVKNGVADIVWTAPGYSAGRFPKTEALELPGVLPLGGVASGKLIWSFYEQNLKEEYAGYKVLAMHGDGGMNFHTAKREIKGAADFVGLKLRAPNKIISRTLATLGATPVAMPASQVTESVAKGVVDGASAVWENVVPIKLDEVTSFHSDTPADKPAMGATVLTVLMNKDKYNALPADLKAVIDRNSGLALVERFGKAWDETIQANKDKVRAKGDRLTVISNEAYADMRKKAEPLEKEWIAEAQAKGFNGEALLHNARALSGKQAR